jgi:hypothetical protein
MEFLALLALLELQGVSTGVFWSDLHIHSTTLQQDHWSLMLAPVSLDPNTLQRTLRSVHLRSAKAKTCLIVTTALASPLSVDLSRPRLGLRI